MIMKCKVCEHNSPNPLIPSIQNENNFYQKSIKSSELGKCIYTPFFYTGWRIHPHFVLSSSSISKKLICFCVCTHTPTYYPFISPFLFSALNNFSFPNCTVCTIKSYAIFYMSYGTRQHCTAMRMTRGFFSSFCPFCLNV